jgi:hypothetical protein
MSIAPVDALFSSCVVLSDFALLVLSHPLHYAVGCPLPVGDIPQVNARGAPAMQSRRGFHTPGEFSESCETSASEAA